MPVAVRPFGVQLLRLVRGQDLAFARTIREQMLGLDDRLKGAAQRAVDDLYDDPFGASPTRPLDTARRVRRQRWTFQYLRTPILDTYDVLARKAQSHVRSGFTLGAVQFRSLIAKLYPARYVPRKEEGWIAVSNDGHLDRIHETDFDEVSRLMEQGEITFEFGTGSVRDAYKDWIGKQMQSGTEPGSLIRTLGEDHVTQVKGATMEMLDKAESFKWAKGEAYKRITGRVVDPSVRTTMENDIMRIVRTSAMQGVNADISDFAERNRDVVLEMERQADGRPCPVCVLLDGKRYPLGSLLSDHPYGMCIFVPVLRTPTEMGLRVPPDIERRAWAFQQREVPSLRDRFFAMPDAEQAKVIDNAQLFKLWKDEKFPIDAIIVQRKGMVTPDSFVGVQRRLPEIGSISYPKAELASGKWLPKSDDLMVVMDPVDRSTAGVVAFREPVRKPKSSKTDKGLDRYSPDVLVKDMPANLRRNLEPRYADGNLSDLPWWRFNEAARALGLYVRKDEWGRLYYVISRGQFTRLAK